MNASSTTGGILVNTGTSGISTNSTGDIQFTSKSTGANALKLHATSGGLDIKTGNNGIQIDTTGEIHINSTTTIDSIKISTTGGMDIDAGVSGIIIDTTGGTSEAIKIWSDFGNSSNLINILSDIGGINITGGQKTGNAIQINASNTVGGINIDAGNAGIIMDTTGLIDIESSKDNLGILLHATGGISEAIKIWSDFGTSSNSINILSDVGGINIEANRNAVNTIYIHTNGGKAETIKIHTDSGSSSNSINIVSDTGGITLDSMLKVIVKNRIDISGIATSGTGLVLGTNIAVTNQNDNTIIFKSDNTNAVLVTKYLGIFIG